MSFNGSGTFNLVSGNPVVTGTTISSTWANNTLSDIASGLSNCLTRDGQSPALANLPMGGYKLTGLGAGTSNGDSVRYEQVTSAVAITGGTISGVSISATSITASLDSSFNSTGALKISVGTTAERPGSPAAGMVRFNSTVPRFEGYNGTAWTQVGGGATGGGTDAIFIENGQTVTTNYTITTNFNAGTFGPVSINSGVTVTVPTGSVWTVV